MRISLKASSRKGTALVLTLLSVVVSGLESFLVQTFSIHHMMTAESLESTATPSLLMVDFLVPLCLLMLSRRAYLVFLVLQSLADAVILHYAAFFYNTLTLSAMYHSMQGLSTLGGSVFIFIRPGIVFGIALVLGVQLVLLRLSAGAAAAPRFLRSVVVPLCLMLVAVTVFQEHGRSGMLSLWTGEGPHKTTFDRRSQEGTKESVRRLGYLATWAGEWTGGAYRDLSLVHAEKRCEDPDVLFRAAHREGTGDLWCGYPLPAGYGPVAMIQVESLDYAALSMSFRGHEVMPFLHSLLPSSLLLRAFAPHKVGSANSDYELLNGRVAEENVMYYSHITQYPDSVVALLGNRRPAVFHGLEGTLFNLRGAYRLMGFDQTFFKEELSGEGYPVSALALEQITDEHVLDAAAKYLEEGRGEAVFVVTMSSHIPFMEPLPSFGLGRGMFARYVSSLHYADDCLASFYARLPEGTLFVLWGDHGSDVPYPSGLKENGRHVPFLVNVKGETSWLAGWTQEKHDLRSFTLCSLSWYLRRMLSQGS